MSGVQQRLKLKQTPIDTWSLKEQLTLTSAVLRTGDQNWVSVSRTMKQFWEPGRPPDWYSQKNCALQYSLIMDKADLPRRKRGEKLEGKDSPGETIVRMLGEQRQEQLRAIIEKEKQDIERLEKQVQLLSSDNVPEEEIQKIIKEIEKEEEEEAKKDEEHALFLKNREEKKMAIQAALKSGMSVYWKGQTAPQSVSEQSGSEVDSAMDSPAAEDSSAMETCSEGRTGGAAPSALPVSTDLAAESVPEVENHVEVENSEAVEDHSAAGQVEEETKESRKDLPPVQAEEEDGKTEVVPTEELVELETKSSVDAQDEDMKIIIVDSPLKSRGSTSSSLEDKPPATAEDKEREIMEDKDKDEEDDDINDAEEITGDDLDEEGKETADQEDADEPKKEEDNMEKEVEDKKLDVEVKETIVTKEEEVKEKEEKMEVVQHPEVQTDLKEKKKETPAPEVPETIPEVKGLEPVKSTPRRGRPRSKKTSEALTETPKLEAKHSVDESGDVGSSRASSPASTRPTSPSPEVNRSGSREGETGSRVLGRRSSRPSGSRSAVDSTPGSPVNSQSQVFKEDEKEAKAWRKSILLVWSQIAAHKHASLFAGPVSEAEAPEYKDIVFQPMDLGTIKKNIENGTIRTTEEFQCDLALMFFNATMYNSSDHAVYKLTLSMQKDADNIVREYLHTQALMKASENPKLRMKEIMEAPVSRTRTGSGSSLPEDKKKLEEKRKRTSTTEEYPAAKKRRLRNFDD